jgi:hypothetical protein
MASIQSAPTSEVLALCSCIDRVIEAYIDGREKGTTRLGKSEAEFEASTLHKLIIRHAEGVVLLARHDLVTLPSALVLARSAFEAHLKIIWLLKPTDPFEQEARWVQHLRSAAIHWGKVEQANHFPAEYREKAADQRKKIEGFASRFESALMSQGNYPVSSRQETLWDILKDLDQKYLYPAYIQLSAFAHSNFEAGSIYRKNLGVGKIPGEFIDAIDWVLPLEATWKSVFVSSRRVLALVEPPAGAFPENALVEEFEKSLAQLKNRQRS